MMVPGPRAVPRADPQPRRLRSFESITCVPSGQAEPSAKAGSSPQTFRTWKGPSPRNPPSTASLAPHTPPTDMSAPRWVPLSAQPCLPRRQGQTRAPDSPQEALRKATGRSLSFSFMLFVQR